MQIYKAVSKASHEVRGAVLGALKIYKIESFVLFNE